MINESLTWEQELAESKKYILAYERLFYVGISILKDNRILIKVINELARSTLHIIRAYLKYESSFGRIRLGKDLSSNIKTFIEIIAPKYLSKDEVSKVINLLVLAKLHKSTPLEFIRNERLVVYYNGKYEVFSKERVVECSRVIKLLITNFPR